MQKIKRFFLELRHPAKKCARVGCREVKTTKRIRREDNEIGSRVIARDFEAVFFRCARCGVERGPEDEKEVDWFSSVSMPNRYWDEIRKNGYTVMEF